MSLIVMVVAWLAGIAGACWLKPPWAVAAAWAAASLALLLAWRDRPLPRRALALLLLAALGALRRCLAQPVWSPGDVA